MSDEIWLEGMTFHAFHGVYAAEKEAGNTFEIDVGVTTDVSRAAGSDLVKDTVNYEQLYAIVKQEMDTPAHLLERVADRIAGRVLRDLPDVKSVELRISKLSPPLQGGKSNKATLKIKRTR